MVFEINSKKLGVKYESYNRVAASVFNERIKCENLKHSFADNESKEIELQSLYYTYINFDQRTLVL